MAEPPRPSNPGIKRPSLPPGRMKAVSAARAQPVKTDEGGPVGARLKSGAQDTALNVAGLLRDTWSDFRSADRYFKYKALVIAGWVLLSGATLFVACPGGSGPHNTLGARLVQTDVAGSPVMMIVNDSGGPWTDVLVIVNGQYRASVGKVSAEAGDNNLILEPRKLLGDGGKPAPASLQFRDITVKAHQGEADLLVKGLPP